MQEIFIDALLGGEAPETSPTTLELLGKNAASLYVEGKARNLTEAVRSIVKEAELNSEQLKRVCEYANREAFRTLLYSAKRPEERGNIEIDLAEADRVAEPAPPPAPPVVKVASSPTRERRGWQLLELAFGWEDEPVKQATACSEAERAREYFKKVAELDRVSVAYIQAQSNFTAAAQNLKNQIDQAAGAGYSRDEIAYALSAFGGPARVKFAMEKIASNVHFPAKGRGIGPINNRHPLVKAFKEFNEANDTLVKLGMSAQQLGTTVHYLRSYYAQLAKSPKINDLIQSRLKQGGNRSVQASSSSEGRDRSSPKSVDSQPGSRQGR